MVYDRNNISLVGEGHVKKEIAGIIRGSNHFSRCIYARVPGSQSNLISVDKETLSSSPTPISWGYDSLLAIDEKSLVGYNFQEAALYKITPDAR